MVQKYLNLAPGDLDGISFIWGIENVNKYYTGGLYKSHHTKITYQ